MGRYCLPEYKSDDQKELTEDEADQKKEIIISEIAKEKFGQYLSDIYTANKVILICAAIALVICILYMILLRLLAGFLAWLSILMILALGIALGIFFWQKQDDYK